MSFTRYTKGRMQTNKSSKLKACFYGRNTVLYDKCPPFFIFYFHSYLTQAVVVSTMTFGGVIRTIPLSWVINKTTSLPALSTQHLLKRASLAFCWPSAFTSVTRIIPRPFFWVGSQGVERTTWAQGLGLSWHPQLFLILQKACLIREY